jgi:hypothetical protein
VLHDQGTFMTLRKLRCLPLLAGAVLLCGPAFAQAPSKAAPDEIKKQGAAIAGAGS